MKYVWLVISLLVLAGCENHMTIINDVDEREANEIIVFLASRDISATKSQSASSSPGGDNSVVLWSITVDETQATQAMAILNQNGLPRKKGTNLLTLFAKQGLMTTDKEETIRYQAGLAEQIANTIRKIDGVIDADVQLSFPTTENTPLGGANQPPQKVTAAVYVKHQGVLDDPNGHLVNKIKRLVSGSVSNLDVNDVTVISDRARFTDLSMAPTGQTMGAQPKEYVSIWSIVMNKDSASRFRFLFFILTFAAIISVLLLGWMIWKFYPMLRKKGGMKEFFQPKPIDIPKDNSEDKP